MARTPASVASTKKGLLKKHSRGARRGNGLKRITEYCRKLGVKLTILSQYGCVTFNTTGVQEEDILFLVEN
ncbi:MAG: hypothetical protein IIC74_10380 [Bacteroidetes bacterium]|nr:hypothetical protein [Bacteroidota bacterium]